MAKTKAIALQLKGLSITEISSGKLLRIALSVKDQQDFILQQFAQPVKIETVLAMIYSLDPSTYPLLLSRTKEMTKTTKLDENIQRNLDQLFKTPELDPKLLTLLFNVFGGEVDSFLTQKLFELNPSKFHSVINALNDSEMLGRIITKDNIVDAIRPLNGIKSIDLILQEKIFELDPSSGAFIHVINILSSRGLLNPIITKDNIVTVIKALDEPGKHKLAQSLHELNKEISVASLASIVKSFGVATKRKLIEELAKLPSYRPVDVIYENHEFLSITWLNPADKRKALEILKDLATVITKGNIVEVIRALGENGSVLVKSLKSYELTKIITTDNIVEVIKALGGAGTSLIRKLASLDNHYGFIRIINEANIDSVVKALDGAAKSELADKLCKVPDHVLIDLIGERFEIAKALGETGESLVQKLTYSVAEIVTKDNIIQTLRALDGFDKIHFVKGLVKRDYILSSIFNKDNIVPVFQGLDRAAKSELVEGLMKLPVDDLFRFIITKDNISSLISLLESEQDRSCLIKKLILLEDRDLAKMITKDNVVPVISGLHRASNIELVKQLTSLDDLQLAKIITEDNIIRVIKGLDEASSDLLIERLGESTKSQLISTFKYLKAHQPDTESAPVSDSRSIEDILKDALSAGGVQPDNPSRTLVGSVALETDDPDYTTS